MSDNRMSMPSGMGGLMRYDAEYSSRFMISPAAAIGFVAALLVFVFLVKMFFPI